MHIFLALPLLFLSFLKDKYKKSLKARFFLYKNLRQKTASVHFHACSFGEVRSIKELASSYDSKITTITQTGFDEAQSFCKSVNFLAFESFLPFWFRSCKVLVVFEAELWLMLFFMAKFRGAKTILINARISEKSFPKYLKLSFFYKKLFSFVDEIFAQSELDKQRLECLGAKNIKILGNIKTSLTPNITKHYHKPKERLIIFASTHEKEEELLLAHFKLKKDEKLIIAPRHPERFERVQEFLCSYAKRENLHFQRLSKLENNDLTSCKAELLLLDRLGELVNFYAICDVVVLCGSFVDKIGGHNPVEVAHFHKPLISGEFFHNQKSSYASVGNIEICKNLQELNTLIRKDIKPSYLIDKIDLTPIKESIQEALNA